LLFAFGTPITLAADAALIVSQSIDAAQTALDEPIARNIETTIASPVERKTVRAMTQALEVEDRQEYMLRRGPWTSRIETTRRRHRRRCVLATC
jgi:hypothetical protein